MIDEVFILEFRFATLVTDFGAHASVSSARGAFPAIFQEFVAIDTHDFLFREKFFALELVAESASERASGNFPEFGDLDSRGIHLEGGSHRRKYGCFSFGRVIQQLHLVFEAVDGVDDVVECV